jgi:hypothetical protein
MDARGDIWSHAENARNGFPATQILYPAFATVAPQRLPEAGTQAGESFIDAGGSDGTIATEKAKPKRSVITFPRSSLRAKGSNGEADYLDRAGKARCAGGTPLLFVRGEVKSL